jgi:hypothetical protein
MRSASDDDLSPPSPGDHVAEPVEGELLGVNGLGNPAAEEHHDAMAILHELLKV